MTKFITEILDEINKDFSKINLYKDNYAITTLLEYAFDPSKVFVLPEGTPPYKKDAAPQGMSPGNVYQQIRKLYIYTRTDVSKLRLEQLFIQLLESIHPSEADVIVAVKDKKLTDKYPNITKSRLIEVGILSAEMFQPEPTADGNGKALVINIDDTVAVKEFFGKVEPTETLENTVPTREHLETLTKAQINELGKTHGVQLDSRKKKETMINDFFNFVEDDGK